MTSVPSSDVENKNKKKKKHYLLYCVGYVQLYDYYYFIINCTPDFYLNNLFGFQNVRMDVFAFLLYLGKSKQLGKSNTQLSKLEIYSCYHAGFWN